MSENIEGTTEHIEINTAEVPVDSDAYLQKAKALVTEDFNQTFSELRYPAEPGHFYVVAFMKTLQNWKALVSTDLLNGFYWEVTYDGAKKQSYIDRYIKAENNCVSDEAYASMS